MAVKINNIEYSGFFYNGEALTAMYLNGNKVYGSEEHVYDPLTDSKYFVIQALTGTTVSLNTTGSPSGSISYRKNGSGEWTTANINANTDITLNQGDYLEFKGNINHASNKYYRFKTSVAKSIDCGGWLAALEKNAEIDSSNNTVTHAFCCLFSGCIGLVNAQDLKLPDNTTENMCRTFFRSCSNLVTTPQLPATTLAGYCYAYMFAGCTNLTTAPQLSVTDLEYACYEGMFKGCTSLVTAPTLSATTLADACYEAMFENCTKLTTAPALFATTLADSCYQYMFQNCKSLVTAPTLPATTLADNCYGDMFHGCTSLVTAPTLPATTLVSGCYSGMFNGCTKLTTAPELPATTLVDYCYFYMFTGCKALTSLRVSFEQITGTNPLNNWLRNNTATGVLYAPSGATYSASDLSLPSNWTLSKTL